MATKPTDTKTADSKAADPRLTDTRAADKKPDAKPGAPAGKDGAAKPVAAKKPINRKLVMIVAAGAVLAIGGGAAAFFMLGAKADDGEHVEKKSEPKKMPVFVDLETFTVNLREPDDERFMQVKLVAELKDAQSGEVLKTMMPAVRSEILLLLGSKQVHDIANREGKETLAKEIVAAANKTLVGTPAEKSVESVNFTHLIVQ